MNAVVQGHERVISLAEAIREGIEESFAKDENTFLFAQGVSDPSSMWGTLKGIDNRFGEDRVIEMPIAEQMQLILEQGKDPREAIKDLMLRPGKHEH